MVRYPAVGTDDDIVADLDTSQYRGVAVDDDVVADNRMTGNPLDRISVLVQLERQRAQRNTLIQFHVVTDNTGGSDDHTRSMIDGEVFADGCRRVNVNACLGMRQFGQHTRNQGYSQQMQLVGQPVVGQSADDRIAGNDFAVAYSGGVTQHGGFHVGGQHTADGRQLGDDLIGDLVRLVADLTQRKFFLILVRTDKAQTGDDLFLEQALQPFHGYPHVVAHRFGRHFGVTEVAWKQDFAIEFNNLL